MPHNVSAGLVIFAGFAVVAGCSWVQSYSPRLFFRLLAPRDEFPDGLPTAWRSPGTAKAMRFMAGLQLAAGAAAALAATLFGKA